MALCKVPSRFCSIWKGKKVTKRKNLVLKVGKMSVVGNRPSVVGNAPDHLVDLEDDTLPSQFQDLLTKCMKPVAANQTVEINSDVEEMSPTQERPILTVYF